CALPISLAVSDRGRELFPRGSERSRPLTGVPSGTIYHRCRTWPSTAPALIISYNGKALTGADAVEEEREGTESPGPSQPVLNVARSPPGVLPTEIADHGFELRLRLVRTGHGAM